MLSNKQDHDNQQNDEAFYKKNRIAPFKSFLFSICLNEKKNYQAKQTGPFDNLFNDTINILQPSRILVPQIGRATHVLPTNDLLP